MAKKEKKEKKKKKKKGKGDDDGLGEISDLSKATKVRGDEDLFKALFWLALLAFIAYWNNH